MACYRLIDAALSKVPTTTVGRNRYTSWSTTNTGSGRLAQRQFLLVHQCSSVQRCLLNCIRRFSSRQNGQRNNTWYLSGIPGLSGVMSSSFAAVVGTILLGV